MCSHLDLKTFFFICPHFFIFLQSIKKEKIQVIERSVTTFLTKLLGSWIPQLHSHIVIWNTESFLLILLKPFFFFKLSLYIILAKILIFKPAYFFFLCTQKDSHWFVSDYILYSCSQQDFTDVKIVLER